MAPAPALALRRRGCAAGAAWRARPRDRWCCNGGRNDGPPDLDELWRDFNRKLSGLFGGKGGGPRGQRQRRRPAAAARRSSPT